MHPGRIRSFGDGKARTVRNNSRGGEGETEPDQVMCGIADHGLIKVADFGLKLAPSVSDGAKIANMKAPQIQTSGPCGTVAESLGSTKTVRFQRSSTRFS